MLHQLKSSKGSTKKRKRLGRGNASGHGTYSSRGLKGQRSRSGASGFKSRGLKTYLTQTPKLGGFKSGKPKMSVISLRQIEAIAKDNETINVQKLAALNLIKSAKNKVKILGTGSLSKPVTVVADAFSESAKEAINKSGGKAVVRNQKK